MARARTVWLVLLIAGCGGATSGGSLVGAETETESDPDHPDPDSETESESESESDPDPDSETESESDSESSDSETESETETETDADADAESESEIESETESNAARGSGGGGAGWGTVGLGRGVSRDPDPRADALECPARPYRDGHQWVECEEDFWRRRTCVSRLDTPGSGMCGVRVVRAVRLEFTEAPRTRELARLREGVRAALLPVLRRCWETSNEEQPPDLVFELLIGANGRVLGTHVDASGSGSTETCAAGADVGDPDLPQLTEPTRVTVRARFVVQ